MTLSNEGLALMDLADGPVFFLLGGPDLRITLFRVLLVITHILSQRRRGRREEQKNGFNSAFSAVRKSPVEPYLSHLWVITRCAELDAR